MSTEKKKDIFARLQAEIDSREKEEGRLSPAVLLSLPNNLRQLMLKITRLGEVTALELASEMEQSESEIEKMLSELVAKGYLKKDKTYHIAYGRKRATKLPQSIWDRLESKL